MTMQFSTVVRNARLDSVEATAGSAPHICFYSGSMPANCAASATGTLIADYALPADWMNAAVSGAKTKNGTWQGAATNSGTIGYFRIKDSSNVAHIQGTCSLSGSGGDMILDAVAVTSTQTVSVVTFTMTDANA